MESAEKTLSEMVSATDYDTTRFFIEEDRSAQREPEAIVQKLKADRQEIEDFYTAVSILFKEDCRKLIVLYSNSLNTKRFLVSRKSVLCRKVLFFKTHFSIVYCKK